MELSGRVSDIWAIKGTPRQFGAYGTPGCGYMLRYLFGAFDFACQLGKWRVIASEMTHALCMALIKI
jgi:hypothetical protein|tara:strand:- start:330 stop:530 length:201 start_codon:yes stop_codon:yes gene_type:complete